MGLETKFICQETNHGLRFDFGGTARMDSRALVALNNLMNALHQTCGGVTVVIENEKLTRQIQEENAKNGKLTFLSLLSEESSNN